MRVPLWKIAHARSGDKADRADIGLFAFDAPTYAVLKREVTPARLAEHFRDMGAGPVELWPLDNLLAIKIVLNRALQGVDAHTDPGHHVREGQHDDIGVGGGERDGHRGSGQQRPRGG